MSSLAQLPPEVLVKVLQHVDQQERLTSCALVSRDWSRAAVAATTSVSHWRHMVPSSSPEASQLDSVSCLQAWMHRHGQQVSRLELRTYSCPSFKDSVSFDYLEQLLRCCQLQELQLSGFSLKLTERSSQPGPQLLPYCSGLTLLDLGCCQFLAGSDSLAALSALTGLRHLSLHCLQEQDCSDFTFPTALLSQLVQLTHLKLDSGTLQGSSQQRCSLEHFSCLTGLRELQLQLMKGLETAEALSGLQHLSQLTRLYLLLDEEVTWQTPFSVDGSRCGGEWLCHLTALQHLYIYNASLLEPSLLAGMTQLRHLYLQIPTLGTSAAGTAALLQVLSQMQQLQHLVVDSDHLHHHPTRQTALYAGLTASKQLQMVDVSGITLPAAAWQHMFEEGRQLPQLQELVLSGLTMKEDPPQSGQADDPAEVPLLTGQHVECLVRCCPNLQQLDIYNSVQQGEHASVLQCLPALNALSSLVISDIDDEAAEVLAQLTGLRALLLSPGVDLTPVGAMQLTALKLLTNLDLTPNFGVPVRLGELGQQFTNKARGSHAPDVHLQLLQLCYRIPECEEAVRQQIAEDACNRAAAARLAVVEAQLQQKEAELVQAQSEAANLRAQLAQLQASAGAVS